MTGYATSTTRLRQRESERTPGFSSSGPIGDPPRPNEDQADIDAILTATQAREHRVFAGRLDRHRLGFGERAVVAALHVADGDFRDGDAIDAWAERIAADMIVAASA